MNPPISIPERISSKRKYTKFDETDEKQISTLNEDIKSKRKKLKPRGSFDSEYMAGWGEIFDLEQQRTELQTKRSMTDFMEGREDIADAEREAWEKTHEAKTLNEKRSAQLLNAKLYQDQAVIRTVESYDQVKLRHFMQLYTMSPKGLKVGQATGMGRRDPRVQSEFRSQLINACNSTHPDEKDQRQWCPIVSGFVEDNRAAHIFPYEQGEVAMESIFGTKNELFGIENGLILSAAAEDKISKGLIVLVPDVVDEFSKGAMQDWAISNPKQYKIRVLDPEAKGMDTYYPSGESKQKTWNSLDGKRVNFSSDHRPRTRYLYWQYCQSLLRRSWESKRKEETAKEEFGKKFWGSRGKYMQDGMLRAFVLEMGHEYDSMLEDITTTETIEPNPMALAAANNAILSKIRKDEGLDQEEGESDDEERPGGE